MNKIFEFFKKNNHLHLSFFLIFFYYLSYILGNFVLNSFSILIIGFSIIKFKKKFFFFYNNKFYIIFFFILIINLIFSFNFESSFERFIGIIKNFLLYISIFLLLSNLNKNFFFKNLGLISLIIVSFVSIDLIYQFFFTNNLFGMITPESSGVRFAGIFYDELIIGGFINLHMFLALFYLRKKNFLIIIIFFMLCLLAIILSGEKKSTLMSIFILLIYFITEINYKKNVKYFFIVCLSFILLFSFVFSLKKVKERIVFGDGGLIRELGFKHENSMNGLYNTIHFSHFRSAIIIWKENVFLGSGMRTFRYACDNEEAIKTLKKYYCTTHPHNYYIEILSEFGIIGFGFFVYSLLKLFLIFKKIKFNINSKNLTIYSSSYFILIFINYLWPLQTTGSFFASKNLIYFCIICAFFNSIRCKTKIN
jgi:O-antigen ligase